VNIKQEHQATQHIANYQNACTAQVHSANREQAAKSIRITHSVQHTTFNTSPHANNTPVHKLNSERMKWVHSSSIIS
jgi:hypothetical protein